MYARIDRDHTVDLLRGFFICVVIVDHIGWFPSLFEVVSGRGRLFASAAESFLLISGVLVGRIRGREVKAGGFGVATLRLVRRAGVLAVWTAIVTLVLHAIAHISGWRPAMAETLGDDGPLRTVFDAITLRYCYGHHCFLSLYAIYLLASPVVLWLMHRGYTRLVLAGSIGLWFGALLVPGTSSWSTELSEQSWQVLFVIGVAVGFHADDLRARIRLTPAQRQTLFAAAVAASAITLALSWLFIDHHSTLYLQLFKREEVGPGRLACALLWTGTLYAAVKRHEQTILRAVGRFFVPLGQHSLYVFLVHAVLIFPLLVDPMKNLLMGTIADATIVAFIWLLVDRKVLFKIIPS